jgi:hypothetical protein
MTSPARRRVWSGRHASRLAVILVVMAAVLPYAATLHYGFVAWDDPENVFLNHAYNPPARRKNRRVLEYQGTLFSSLYSRHVHDLGSDFPIRIQAASRAGRRGLADPARSVLVSCGQPAGPHRRRTGTLAHSAPTPVFAPLRRGRRDILRCSSDAGRCRRLGVRIP